MLAASASGSGKTLITCGMLQALTNRGLRTASFKCGPDYIDPMFHTRVIGTPSRNLDPFFCDADTLRYLLGRRAGEFEISVLEGVMGYYDGLGGTDFTGSSYDLARITDTPVILIINARGMSRTVSALIRGLAAYREDSHIAGVILNRMSGSIYPELKALIEEECGIPVVGYVPPVPELVIDSMLEAIESGAVYNGREKSEMTIGVHMLPKFPKDTTDRNRTSPFAFTGNKFEFRSVGSSASIATANVVLNTIVAESLRQFAEELEGAENFQETLHDLIVRTIREHRRIIFNGNNYAPEWAEEAKRRGLLRLDTAVDAVWKNKGFYIGDYMPDQMLGENAPETLRSLVSAAVTTLIFLPLTIHVFDRRDVK